ncbi:MAG TPA: sulfatase [Candidatus Limnocylindrales bacterium]|nr:sulfatase [Candidatus Limnocylindrales bacterium]
MMTQEKKSVLSTPSIAPGKLLLLAAWFALATGLGEISIRAVQKFFLHQRIYVSPQVVWMAPLADLVLFLLSGSILLLVARFWPRATSPKIVVFIFALLGFSGPLLWFPKLHILAALLLAIGLSVQTARLLEKHISTFYLFSRYTLGGMLAVVMALAVGINEWQVLIERNALAKLPPAPPGTPNVLLIVLDTVRASSLSLYGYNRPTTPSLEKLAKTGVVFEKAFATSSWTLPSHASLFTARYPHEVSADWLKPLDATYPVLAEVFQTYGYVTAGFVANLLYGTYETGLARGFIHYEDYPISPEMVIKSSWLARIFVDKLKLIKGDTDKLVYKWAEEINEDFLSWLSCHNSRPFFVFLNYMDAHAPYLPPKPFDTLFGPKRPRPDKSVRRTWSPQEIQVERDAYEGCIAYLDHQLGLLFDELQKRGILENTLIVITSDHGEQFGEHGLFDHGNSLYRPSLQVPLFISFPGRVPAGRRVHEAVTLRDIPATILDLVKPEASSRFPGHSLARYWKGTDNSHSSSSALLSEISKCINMPAWLPACKGDMKSLVTDGMHYIRNGDGREELYDLENDPAEEQDLANSEEGRQRLEEFRRSLETILRSDRFQR